MTQPLYDNAVFDFYEIENPEIIFIKNKKYLKLGISGAMKYPIVQDMQDDGAIYYDDGGYGLLCFINSSWAQFLETAKKINEFYEETLKICKPTNPAFYRKNKNQPIDKNQFAEHLLPLLSIPTNKQKSQYEVFSAIVEKFDFNKSWAKYPNYVYDTYNKWIKDYSVCNMWELSYTLEHKVGIKIKQYKLKEQVEKICALIKRVKTQLHKIDERAYYESSNFWVNILFGFCTDFYQIYTLDEPSSLNEPHLVNFTFKGVKKYMPTKKSKNINEDALPF